MVDLVKGSADGVVKRVEALVEERRQLQRRLDESMRGGGDQVTTLLAGARQVNGARVVAAEVRVADAKELQALADALRERLGTGVAVLGASIGDKTTMLVVVTDDLREKGVRADALVRDIAAIAGGRGGGKPHLAQAGIPDSAQLSNAIEQAPQIIERALATA